MSRVSSWLDDFVGVVQNLTDTPLLFIRAAAYFTAGSALRKQVYFRSNTDVYPNLYYLFVAPPFRFHKTTAWELAKNILHAECGSGPLVSEHHFLPQDGSDVAFDDAMVDAEGYGIAYYEEFSKFIGSAKREYTSGIQCKFLEYFSPSMLDKKSRTRKDGEKVVRKGSVVNFASACTDEDFEVFMTSGAVTSGQMSRLLVLKPTESDARPTFDPQPETPTHFYTDMSAKLKKYIPKIQHRFAFSKDAQGMIKDVTKQLDSWYNKEPNGLLIRSSTSRYVVILQRLSMIHAAMRMSPTIEAEDIEAPFNDIMNPYLATVKRFNKFGYIERPDQILRSRICKRVENGKATPIHVLARDLNEPVTNVASAIKTLEDQGHVYSVKYDDVNFYVAYDESDQDRDTKVTREEKVMERFRAKLLEEKAKGKMRKGGSIYVPHERQA